MPPGGQWQSRNAALDYRALIAARPTRKKPRSWRRHSRHFAAGGNLVVRGGAYSSRGSGDSPAGPAAAPLATAEAAPGRARLEVYPNPMSERATIRFQVPTTGNTQLRVYNALGQVVATLFDQEAQAGQAYEIGLAGTGLAEGLYTCRLRLGGQQYTQRVMLTR